MDIHGILRALADERPVFHSEADFQFAFAWRIRETTGEEVRLEYPPHPGDRTYLDIWLPDSGTAIELKYFTRKLDSSVDGESFFLKDQGAQDLGRYDFLKDIRRVERVARGFVVALANDPLYWQPPKGQTKDAAFRIHDGRQIAAKAMLHWKAGTGKGTMSGREDSIRLRHRYRMSWRDYGSPLTAVADTRCGRFRYLAIEVPPER